MAEYTESVTDSLVFSDEAIVSRGLANGLELSDSLKQILPLYNSLVLDDAATAEVIKPITGSLQFSDSVIRAPMAFNRHITDFLVFDSYGSGFNAGASPYGDCSGSSACTRDNITFTYGITSVDLRNPSEDSIVSVLNLINRYTRGEELRMAGVHPRFIQLKYQFTKMPAAQKDAFIAFYKASAGMEVTLIDFCNQTWVGCILDHDIAFELESASPGISEPGCPDPSLWSWALIFEGERV